MKNSHINHFVISIVILLTIQNDQVFTKKTVDFKFSINFPECNETEGMISNSERAVLTSSRSYNLVPLMRIGTTDLYSGIFYRIGMKRFPFGYLVWADKNTRGGEGNFIEIDMNPMNPPKYTKEGVRVNDTLWSFAPSVVNGLYTLRNKGKPSDIAMISFQNTTQQDYLILARDPNLIYTSLLSNSNAIFFKPVGDPESQATSMYAIQSEKNPDGFITWTDTLHGYNSHYIHLNGNPDVLSKYGAGQELYDDKLFRLDPPEAQLYGTIQHLIFSAEPFLNETMEKTKRIKVGESIILANDLKKAFLHKTKKTIQGENIASISINPMDRGYLSIFKELKAMVSLNLGPGFNFNFKTDLNIDPKTLNSEEVSFGKQFIVETEVEVAPESVANITYYMDRIENLDLTFKAVVAVKGITDRISGDYSKILAGPAPPEMLRSELNKIGASFSMKNDKDTAYIWIAGKLKGSFVSSAWIEVEQVLDFNESTYKLK